VLAAHVRPGVTAIREDSIRGLEACATTEPMNCLRIPSLFSAWLGSDRIKQRSDLGTASVVVVVVVVVMMMVMVSAVPIVPS